VYCVQRHPCRWLADLHVDPLSDSVPFKGTEQVCSLTLKLWWISHCARHGSPASGFDSRYTDLPTQTQQPNEKSHFVSGTLCFFQCNVCDWMCQISCVLMCVCVDTDGRMFVVCWWKKDISLSINLSPKKNIRKCSISISSNLIAGPVFLFNKIPTQCEPGQLDMFGWSDPYKTWSNQGAYITPVNTLKYKEIQGAGRLHDWLLLKPRLETSHGLLE